MTNAGSTGINFEDAHEISLRVSENSLQAAENVYVDSVLTLMLPVIQSRFDFVLKGGTAIVKTHLYPYRFSYDLDFSYFAGVASRKHYRIYQKSLEDLITRMGFHIVGNETDKHREGGKIFILRLVDGPGYFRMPIKLSISSIDKEPCCAPLTKKFKPLFGVPEEPYGLLYPDVVDKLNSADAKVLAIDELCSEKIRALATRGSGEEWSLILRDAVDLHVMAAAGILNRVLSDTAGIECVKKKFLAIRNTSYWAKFHSFLISDIRIRIGREDAAIFIDKKILDEKEISETVEKVRDVLKNIVKL
ncbi:MAG: nucleotidyl transferase AbiEii/AbiGii toxin family protein [Candidatus Thermoplasmatota archaeon]|nr:nucleotidyl transferase AbiEii/AbiGii toxin family protein [Candidatus Thermoplasmatota archaeon]